MIFLVEYNRPEGRLVTFQRYDDSQTREADAARLQLDLELNRKGIEHEVVILEAATEADVRKTHRRYFETLRQILENNTLMGAPFKNDG